MVCHLGTCRELVSVENRELVSLGIREPVSVWNTGLVPVGKTRLVSVGDRELVSVEVALWPLVGKKVWPCGHFGLKHRWLADKAGEEEARGRGEREEQAARDFPCSCKVSGCL